jgi:Outer membrane lipoprotein-sorting protein
MSRLTYVSFGRLIITASVALIVSAPISLALDAKQIIDRASEAQRSLGNVVIQSKLTVSPKTGTPRETEIRMRMRIDDKQTRSWIGVVAPAALKGMQFVRNSMSPTDDQLLMYVPSTKQVQQVPPAAREKKFLNSDFSLADLHVQATNLVQAKIVEETEAHWVVAARPSGPSMYEWILFTIDKQDFAVLRVTFYQVGHKMVKDLNAREFTKVNDTRLATRVEMKDLTSGSLSTLEITSLSTNVPADELPLQQFSAESLRSQTLVN